jgi:pimeloyl-ACP methyl ester carboxylesterase
MTQPLLQAADLRGAARLTTDGVAGLTSLVEAVQTRFAPDPKQPLHAEREAVVAELNGVLGDHLAATDNPLAIPMAFRHAGRTLALERFALRSRLPAATPRLLVLLHGLGLNDLQWQRADHDHGQALAQALGFTPVYLHYNSGLSVSTNGRVLAQMMERLFDAWPVPIERLVMLGHSMGGLVARSAIHHGLLIQRGNLRWPERVGDLVCLGTPHQGAPLERAGHGLDVLLNAAPYAAPLARLGKVRSAGINDMRLGNITSGPAGDDGTHRCAQVPLPATARCFTLAACLGPDSGSLKGKLLDDGLVPVASALGQHHESDRRLAFPAERQAVVHGTSHLDLLSSAQVFERLLQWLGPAR